MQSLKIEDRSMIFDDDYNTVLKAVLTYCNEKAFPILTVDKELGLINTDWKELSNIITGTARMKINFIITDVKGKTKVSANIQAQQPGIAGQWSAMTMMEVQVKSYYKKLFDGIKERL